MTGRSSGAAAEARPAPAGFNARLDEAMARLGSLLCVGLDPRDGEFEGTRADFCRRIIDATFEAAVAFKPNSAFFEAAGAPGWAELEQVIGHLAGERLVILDAKRGDIGSTAEAYARAAFRTLRADAVTVSPYLGGDAVAPFLADAACGAFVLCHTSNPGALDFQSLDVGGRPLYQEVARRAGQWNGRGNVGLVVGATYPEALAAVRALAPDLPVLLPGVGAQGGQLDAALDAGLDQRGRGVVVSSSRAILRAADPRDAALRLRDEIDAARRGRGG
jgi:orotidine 5'-phosphate decarboxylase subfamily 2